MRGSNRLLIDSILQLVFGFVPNNALDRIAALG